MGELPPNKSEVKPPEEEIDPINFIHQEYIGGQNVVYIPLGRCLKDRRILFEVSDATNSEQIEQLLNEGWQIVDIPEDSPLAELPYYVFDPDALNHSKSGLVPFRMTDLLELPRHPMKNKIILYRYEEENK